MGLPDPRRVALASAAAAAAVAGGLGLLVAEGYHARSRAGVRTSSAPYSDGRYGPRTGTSYRLVMLGDSSAAGLGVRDPLETVGGLLATGVSNLTDRAVVLATMAVVGAQSRDLAAQVERALVIRPHVAVIMIGANDVTHLRGTRRPVRELVAAVQRLQSEGVEVIVGTCPDLATVRLFPEPLRSVAGYLAASMARAQHDAALAAGARVVPLARLLGREFDVRPHWYFSEDRFHPSAVGYATVAAAVMPSVLMALGEPDLVVRLAADSDSLEGPASKGLPSPRL